MSEPHKGCADRACECVVRERDEALAEAERLREALTSIKARCDSIVAGEFGGLNAALDMSNEARRALAPAATGGEGCIGGPHRRGSAPGSCADCEAAVDGYTGGEGCIGGPHRRGSAPGSCADCEAAVDGYTGEERS